MTDSPILRIDTFDFSFRAWFATLHDPDRSQVAPFEAAEEVAADS